MPHANSLNAESAVESHRLRRVTVGLIVGVVVYALLQEYLLRAGLMPMRTRVAHVILLTSQLAVNVVAGWAASHARPVALRRNWRLLFTATLLTTLATLVRIGIGEASDTWLLQISRADWLDFISYFFYLAGLFTFAIVPRATLERWKWALDVLCIALAAGIVFGYLLLVVLGGFTGSSLDWIYLLAGAGTATMVFPVFSHDSEGMEPVAAAVLSLAVGLAIVADLTYALLHQQGISMPPTLLLTCDVTVSFGLFWAALHSLWSAPSEGSRVGLARHQNADDIWGLVARALIGIGVLATAARPVLTLAHAVGQRMLIGTMLVLFGVLWVRDAVIRARNEQLHSDLRSAAEDLQRRVEERTQQLTDRIAEVQRLRVSEALRAEELRGRMEELKRSQMDLLRSQRLSALGQMAAGAAHELNNPLTIVRGYTEILLAQHSHDAEQADLARILGAVERCQKVINNLLDFGRSRPVEREPLEINLVLQRALVLCEYDLDAAPIRISQQLDPDLPLVRGDEHLLQQVFLNVILNARQAMHGAHGRGRLIIHTFCPTPERSTVHIEISDDGPGMDPEVIDRAFDPFFTTKEPGQGVGLGLSVCYGIVHEHQGRIWAQSPAMRPTGDALGVGTTVVIELPAIDRTEMIG